MNRKILLSILIVCCSSSIVAAQTNKYWVGASIYRNSLLTAADIAEWTLTNDNGTGSWTTSVTGSSILTVDNAAGGYANKIENTISGSPRLLPLDDTDGKIELQVIALTGGTQFSIHIEEYSAANTLIISPQIEILGLQSNPGFFTIQLSDFSFNSSTTQIRFIISAQNASTQGTLELNYFNYFNTDNSWTNAANWASTSGGTGGAGVPGSLDNAIFDAFSATNAIVNQPASIANINLSSTYRSGLINAGSNNFTVTGFSQLTGGFMVGVNDHLFVHDVTVSGTQFVSTSGTITITGTLTYVSGNFKPANGTMIFVSSSTQTIPAINFYNLTLNGSGIKNATGSFTVSGNFVNNSTFNAAGNTVVFNGSSPQSISGSSTTTFNNLNVSNTNSAVLTLSSPVRLTGILTLATNARIATGGNLTLVATSPTVTASIANLTGAFLTGNVKVQKYIYSSLRIYRYLSSPVAGATVADWQAYIPITGTFSNPSTGTGIVSTSPSMFLYNEAVPGVRANGYEAYPGTGVTSSSAPLTAGKGYSIYVRNNAGRPTVMEVNGAINRGVYNFATLGLLTYTPSAGGITEDGWNLIGNPYPSSIDWSLVPAGDRTGIDNAIYYLDNSSGSPVYRSWVNGVGTLASSGVISSSQAFWVKANAASPVLRLRETFKTAATPSFYRVGNDLALLRISLDSTSSTFQDETVIRLSDEATIDFDSEYDAYKLYDTGHPAIGSATKMSPLLSVNALAVTGNSSDTIALFVQTGKAGNYSLSVPEYTFDASMSAYLWDTYTDAKQLLVEGSTYPFSVSADSAIKTNRFKVLLNEQSLTTGVFTSSVKKGMILFPNPTDASRSVTIRCPEAKNFAADIDVYDVTGILVYSERQVQGANTEYPFTLPQHLSAGMYSIRIQTGSVTASSTILIK